MESIKENKECFCLTCDNYFEIKDNEDINKSERLIECPNCFSGNWVFTNEGWTI